MILRPARVVHGSEGGLAVSAMIALALLCSPGRALAQAASVPDPHTAQPERPTVATHAHTIAPGWLEIEAGVQRQQEGALADRIYVPLVVKIGLGSHVQLDLAPGWDRDADHGHIQSGVTDLIAGVKWRLTDAAPVIGAFAVQATMSLPSGNANAGRGSGAAGVNLLAISSHQFGQVSVDANIGYTRFGGDGSVTPNNSTMWTVAAGVPVAARLSWVAEIFGLPGTSGPAGAPPLVAMTTGPTFTVRPHLVLDAGAIFDVEGFGGTAVYAGVTWNIGRIWRSSPRPSRSPLPRNLM